MGFYYAVRGWLGTRWPEQFQQVKAFVERNDSSGYGQHWVFPQRPPGFSPPYVFYGGEVRDVSLGDIRDVIRAIAETVRSFDGDIIDYIEGYFHADAEDGSIRLTWECRDGRFYEFQREGRSVA